MYFVTVNYCGGLGNQLFQIFTLISYSIDTKKIPVLTFSDKSPSITPRSTYWETVFSSFKNFSSLEHGTRIQLKDAFAYTDLPNIDGNVILDGYFQSYKYFDKNSFQIKYLLNFEDKIEAIKSKFFNEYLQRDEDELLLSVHFRLGDYKKLQEHHPILPPSYYENAMKLLSGHKVKVLYFCEKEDIEIVERMYIPVINASKIVRVSSDIPDWEQLFLMSLCDWNIIANSSFSWWGAYLNKHQENVIYPSKWFHTETPHDLIPSSWKGVYPQASVEIEAQLGGTL
jgi:hypothetical protein